MKLSIVIPVYNERETILEVLRRVRGVALPIAREIVVVDDGSTDGTADVLRALPPAGDLVVCIQAVNGGKGTAVREGVARATGNWIVIQDADLELDPADLPLLLAPALAAASPAVPAGGIGTAAPAQVFYGSRYRGRSAVPRNLSFWANQALTLLTNLLFGARLTDMETCYKLFPAALLKSLRLEARRFDIEPEVTAKTLRLGHAIGEVAVAYHPRTTSQGKKMRWRDGLGAVWMLVRCRLARKAVLAAVPAPRLAARPHDPPHPVDPPGPRA